MSNEIPIRVMENDTPETNAKEWPIWPPNTNGEMFMVPSDFARKLERERDEARKDLERERGRLAVCGVVAMANTEESAKRARGFDAKYQSASCDDVARIVDSEMQLRRERDEAWEKLHRVLKLLDDYDEAIKNPSSPFLAAFKKWFTWGAAK